MDSEMILEPPSVRMFYRALLTLRAVPDPDYRYLAGVETAWVGYARRAADAYGYAAIDDLDELEARFVPTPHDVAIYLDRLKWGRSLSTLQWRVMECRADDYSLPLIADVVRFPLGIVRTEFRIAVEVIEHAATKGIAA